MDYRDGVVNSEFGWNHWLREDRVKRQYLMGQTPTMLPTWLSQLEHVVYVIDAFDRFFRPDNFGYYAMSHPRRDIIWNDQPLPPIWDALPWEQPIPTEEGANIIEHPFITTGS